MKWSNIMPLITWNAWWVVPWLVVLHTLVLLPLIWSNAENKSIPNNINLSLEVSNRLPKPVVFLNSLSDLDLLSLVILSKDWVNSDSMKSSKIFLAPLSVKKHLATIEKFSGLSLLLVPKWLLTLSYVLLKPLKWESKLLNPVLSLLEDLKVSTKFNPQKVFYLILGNNGLFKGLVPLWCRQVPYTVVKFVAFEAIVEKVYASFLTKPKSEYSKAT